MPYLPYHFKRDLLIGLLSLAFIILPLMLMFLRRGKRTVRKRFLTAACYLMYALIGASFTILVLLKLDILELEWRGGYVPVLTKKRTRPDFQAVEQSRAAQTNTNVPGLPPSPALTANWPGFRGPREDGRYDDQPILTNWPTNGLRRLWKQPCGGGYSSFAMVNGRAYTLEQRRDQEVVVAYDLETGRELWTNGWTAKFSEYHSDEGPRSTPTYDDGRIYAFGATGEFRCLDATNGATIWGTNVVIENGGKVPETLPDYGLASSPLVVDDKLILQPDAYHGKSIVCYDKRTGKQLWHALDVPMGYAAPQLATLGGEKQVIVCARPNIYGLRLDDGAEQWSYEWHIINNERPITQPLQIASNRFVMSAAYVTGAAAFEVDRTNNTFTATELWRNRNLKTKFASAVYWDGYIYGLDEDIMVCLDASTGERKWKDGRYGYGQVLLASGHLVILCANGDLALVKATPEKLTEVARFPALQGKSWNVPAIGGGRLLVRNGAEMACYDISAEK